MNIAIVTGASEGLGKAFAEKIIKKYIDLDEIWIIARGNDKLKELEEKYKPKVRAISLDLSKNESYQELEELLNAEKPNIKILISNAGVAKNEPFITSELQSQLAMVELNVKGYVAITRICLPYMKEGSFIIEVCSVSSFAPTPNMTVYSSSKVFVSYFSRGLREELKSKHINVLCLCPGNMNTNMNKQVEQNNKNGTIGKLPYLDMNIITTKALDKAEKGKAIYTPNFIYKLYRLISKIIPHAVLIKFTKV